LLKKILKVVGLVILVAVLAVAAWVGGTVYRFNASMAKVYDIPPPGLSASTDPEVIERGRHLSESVGGCSSGDCHGSDLSGGEQIEAGPIGSFTAPNLTPGHRADGYSDGQIARLLLHGVKADGRSVRFMPAHHISWLPDDDLVAIISYVRSVPPVDKADGPIRIGLLGRILDRLGKVDLDIARRIDHTRRETAPEPSPTALFGAFLARGCSGCHGEHLSGGRIPGAPPEMPVPANITPDATGLRDWSFADFEHLLATGLRPDGRKLHPMMPVQSLNNLNEVEKRALWEYLRSLPARPFGSR